MRVAIIVTRLEQLGPILVMQALVNALVEYHSLIIKVFYIDKPVDLSIKLLAPIAQLDPEKFKFNDFDLVHTSGMRPDLFAFRNRKKIKHHISTIHNIVFNDLTFTYDKVRSIIFGNLWLILWLRADKLVCLSEEMRTYYSRWFSLNKLEVIYNGIGLKDNYANPDDEVVKIIQNFRHKGYKIIGTIGILNKRKGIDQILYALADLNEFVLIVIGDGSESKNLKNLAIKLKIADRIAFCGFRNYAINYYKYFDVYLSASRCEGFGLTLAEASGQGVPIICSDIPVFTELFSSEEVVFFRLNDIISLKNAISTPHELMKTKSILASEKFKNKYTAKIMAGKYCDLYNSVN
jgi:L-malate glycosyltransferase